MLLKNLLFLISFLHAFSLVRADDLQWVIDERSGCVKGSGLNLANLSDILRREQSVVCDNHRFTQYHREKLSVEYRAVEYPDSVYRLHLVSLVDAVDTGTVGKSSVIFLSETYTEGSIETGPVDRRRSSDTVERASMSVLSGYTLIQAGED